MRLVRGWILGLVLCGTVGTSLAEWQVDTGRAELSFVSIKAGDVAELNRFGQVTGTLGDDGAFLFTVELDSVDTRIEIRDQRMREYLFQTLDYPLAVFSGQVEMSEVQTLRPGDSVDLAVEGELNLHGASRPLTVEVSVIRLGDQGLKVVSRQPVLLNAGDFALTEGVERLRQIAGLSSISLAVPVTFNLQLTRH
jgi:polyisoprenoid-binding protein YceI